MTIAEAVQVMKTLVPNHDRPRPDPYHARTGHNLPIEESELHRQLNNVNK